MTGPEGPNRSEAKPKRSTSLFPTAKIGKGEPMATQGTYLRAILTLLMDRRMRRTIQALRPHIRTLKGILKRRRQPKRGLVSRETGTSGLLTALAADACNLM
jgi:hypothetical protein